MVEQYPDRVTFGGIYIALLLIGIWQCVFRHPRNPRAYSLTGAALALALLIWIVRPVLLHDGHGVSIERIPDRGDLIETIIRSLIDSLLSALPIVLMSTVVYQSWRDTNNTANLDGTDGEWLPRYLCWILIVGVNFLLATLTVTAESNWYRLTGAVPYQVALSYGISFCLMHGRQMGPSGRFVCAALVLALIASYVQPWFARIIHLMSFQRRDTFHHDYHTFYEYESAYILVPIHFFVCYFFEAVPVLLLAWSVFRLPEPSPQAAGVKDAESASEEVTSASPAREPIDSPTVWNNLLTMCGWGLFVGIGVTALFIGFTLTCSYFFEEQPSSQAHGALGITTGFIVLMFGIIPVFLFGAVAGVVIAAKRARRAK